MNGTMRAMSLWREKFEGLKKEEQFKNLALLYYSAPYEWGHEIPLGTDCSGLICGPLILMGHEIRITADQIRTMLCSPHGTTDLIFFLRDDKATHVGIILDRGSVIHASGDRGVVIEDLGSLIKEYERKGETYEINSLDFTQVKKNIGLVYDLDTDLH
jgi:cell wall-associated NlpC family hydrolase